MNARERELLTGMGNCYEACGEDFEETVRMVASSRHRAIDDVKTELGRMREAYGQDAEYVTLRERLPRSFPL